MIQRLEKSRRGLRHEACVMLTKGQLGLRTAVPTTTTTTITTTTISKFPPVYHV